MELRSGKILHIALFLFLLQTLKADLIFSSSHNESKREAWTLDNGNTQKHGVLLIVVFSLLGFKL